MSECIKEILDDDLSGISRQPGEKTAKKCGESACDCTLTFIGMGEDEKPMAVEQSSNCWEDSQRPQ